MSVHISSKKDQIAKTVIMPGDPLRAKYIAENFLDSYEIVSTVRANNVYTGKYQGKDITVMSSGMGMASASIYVYELFNEYDVDTIIRIGTMGSYVEDIKVKDLFLATSSYTDSNIHELYNGENKNTVEASSNLVNIIKNTAKDMNLSLKEGMIHSSNLFYRKTEDYRKPIINLGALGVEMESFILYAIATSFNKQAATILTVSDSFVSDEILTSEERETSLNEMISLALNAALNI